MKIIKRPNTEWSMKYTCSNCTAELEIEKGDVRFHSYPGDMREPGYNTWTTNCPVCDVLIDIAENKLPKAVQVEIKKKGSGSSYGGPFDR